MAGIALAGVSCAAMVQAAAAQAPAPALRSAKAGTSVRLAIPRGPLESGLVAFTEQAGVKLVYPTELTATLETGLLGTPMIVCYRLSPWTFALARWLVRVPHVSLVNLVLGRRAVPELIQADASPTRIARQAIDLLDSRSDVDRMRVDLQELRPRLGAPGASGRAAEEVARVLERERAA